MKPEPTDNVDEAVTTTPTFRLFDEPNADRVTLGAFEVPVAVSDCTTAAEPFVPPVSTGLQSKIAHTHESCVLAPVENVTAPVVGEAPNARNTVTRRKLPVVAASVNT